MITFIHRIVAIPRVYDLTQWLAGAPISHRIFKHEFDSLPQSGEVLDVGGGTGLLKKFFSDQWRYTCLDMDEQKLAGFINKFPKENALKGSSCSIPLPDNCMDCCLLKSVSHHLDDSDFQISLQEMQRVLKPDGYLLFIDAYWNPKKIRGRLLWKLDRGSYPRTPEVLKREIQKYFEITRIKQWSIHHDYLFIWCKKNIS